VENDWSLGIAKPKPVPTAVIPSGVPRVFVFPARSAGAGRSRGTCCSAGVALGRHLFPDARCFLRKRLVAQGAPTNFVGGPGGFSFGVPGWLARRSVVHAAIAESRSPGGAT